MDKNRYSDDLRNRGLFEGWNVSKDSSKTIESVGVMMLGGDGMHTFDGLGVKLEALLLVDEELLDILALVALELNHLAHLGVVDNGAIASCSSCATRRQRMTRAGGKTTPMGRTWEDGAKHTELLLDDLEDLLLVELLRQTLHRGQGLSSIPLLNADMYVVLSLDGIASVLIGFGEGVCNPRNTIG